MTMVFENNTTIEYNADTPDGDDGDGEEEDDIAAESSSNAQTLVLMINGWISNHGSFLQVHISLRAGNSVNSTIASK